MSVERIVAFLTPAFAVAAGWLSTAVAKYGLHLDPTALAVAFGTGATAATGAAIKWLHGRQLQLPYLMQAEKDAKAVVAVATKADPLLLAEVKNFVVAEVDKRAPLVAPVAEAPAPVVTVVPATPPAVPPAA